MATKTKRKRHNAAEKKAIIAKIAEEISKGAFLTQLCGKNGIPSHSTIHRWLYSDKTTELWDMYARAIEMRCDYWLVEIMDIADDTRQDTTTRRNKNGDEYEAPDHEWLNRSRLRVDTRKWAMAKLWPKKYGDSKETKEESREVIKPPEIEVIPANRPIPRRPDGED